ncbi:uncharacterized protein LOC125869902 [Solanum stenotomum]|uniref:uncharacterized protein LOC125869902 n=1 Tax=Solanum stenotomum TaxID=172797 RepID=UPI0020D04CFD|nr:uncharacterized protein LOC125869902 [Solanum stenotomum]
MLQKVESTDVGVKEMKGDFFGISQMVDSHTTSIKQIEQQLGQLSASLNQRKNGSLPSDTIQNPKKDGHCMAITTRSGKILNEPVSVGTKQEHGMGRDEEEDVDAEHVDDTEEAQPTKKLKKKAEDGKFAKFITILRQLSVNIPLVEALEKMPRYAKFMKDLVTKKQITCFELSDNIHHCSTIARRSLVQKKKDLGSLTIPCTIRSFEFAKALCDLGASITLMSLAIYKKLGLGIPNPTAMRFTITNKSVKQPTKDHFLATCQTLLDVESGEMKFRLNNEEVKFKICRSMKQLQDSNVVSPIVVFDEWELGAAIEEMSDVETLKAMLMNFEEDF